MENLSAEMAKKSFVIPESFMKEFKGDIRIIFDGSTQGIWVPPEVLEKNADLLRKYSKNFDTILVPKSFK
jgi:hypothetical protein